MDNPSVVVGHLSDEEIKKSIESIVVAVDTGARQMAQKFDEQIVAMENSFKRLGNLKVDFGSAENSSGAVITKQQKLATTAVKETTQAVKEQNLNLDQQAQIIQKATTSSGARAQAEQKSQQILSDEVTTLDRLKQQYTSYEQLANRRFDVSPIQALRMRQHELEAGMKAAAFEAAKAKKDVDDLNLAIESYKRTIASLPKDKNGFAQRQAIQQEVNDMILLRDVAIEEQQRWVVAGRQLSAQYENTKAQIRGIGQEMIDAEQKEQALVQGAQRYSEEVMKQARAIRESEEWKTKGRYAITVGDTSYTFYDPEKTIIPLKQRQSLEEQIVSSMELQNRQAQIQRENQAAVRAETQSIEKNSRRWVESQERMAKAEEEKLNSMTTEVSKQGEYNARLERAKTLLADIKNQQDNMANALPNIRLSMTAEDIQRLKSTYESLSEAEKKSTFGKELSAYIKQLEGNLSSLTLKMEDEKLMNDQLGNSYITLSNKLRRLESIYHSMSESERNNDRGRSIADNIQRTERALREIQQTAKRPIDLASVLKLPEDTIDRITQKIQALNSYKRGLKLTDPHEASELQQVDSKIKQLTTDLDKYMGKARQANEVNNALARSWNYMKNRLAFYFTVGASTQFVKELVDIRSQYEMNERALGVLIDSAEKGTQIFNELSQMALVSPYTLIELSNAARQLTAYDVAAKDVVDTTRRMADISAAVGIPMERLTYALGQIKAYGYLNSRDARMFLNAGIPLVKALADHYTELEGRMVSVGDVYDRIKKKAVGYNDVMQVVNEMTDEGGRFFDFQAKMADTLKVQMANLTLAWNNMLNDIGKSEQGVLVGGIKLIKELFLQWKNVEKVVRNVVVTVAIAKLIQLFRIAAIGADALTKQMSWQILVGRKLSVALAGVATSLKAIITNPLTWWALLATAVVSAGMAIYDANKAVSEFNDSIRKGAEDNYKNISQFLEQYQSLRDSLWKSIEVEDKGGNKTSIVSQSPVDIDKREAEKAWEAVREQIELTSQSSEVYISNLLSIENVSERLRQGFAALDDIKAVNAALKDMNDNTINVSQEWSAWWNLWVLPDGLVQNVKDFAKEQETIAQRYGDIETARKRAAQEDTMMQVGLGSTEFDSTYIDNYDKALQKLKSDVETTTTSILNFIELKGWSGDAGKIGAAFDQITQKIINENNLSPEQAFILQKEVEEAKGEAMLNGLKIRIADEKNALKLAVDEETRYEINERIKALEIQKAEYEKTTGDQRAHWGNFTKWMKEQHISEMQQMFRCMDAEQIKSLNFQSGQYGDWVKRMVTQYAKEHKMSYDEAFKYLKHWVADANMWSIFIPLTISTEDNKSVKDQLEEYDKQIDEADAAIERLTVRKKELEKITKRNKKENEEYTRTLEEIADAEKAKADAESKGGHGKKEKKDEKADAKARKEAESELMKALKEELSLIDNIRNNYKKLTKEGETHTEAIERAVSGYDKTVNGINKVLQKYGVNNFNPSDYAGVEDPNKLVELLKAQITALISSGLAKTSEIKDLEVKIQSLEVEARSYNLKKVTDGLNNELSKLKDEYELALELDADPILGEVFKEMFNIDPSGFPNSIDDYMDKVQDVFDSERVKNGYMQTLNVFKASEQDWKDWAESVSISEEALKSFSSKFIEAQGVAKKWAENTAKETENLQYKLADTDGKIAIENEKLQRLMLQREKSKNEEERKLLDLKIKDQTETIARLGDEVLQMLPTYKSLFNSIAEHSAYVTRKIAKQWKEALESAKKNADGTYTITDPKGGTATIGSKEYGKQVDKVNQELRKTASTVANIKEAFTKGDDGEVDFAKGLEYVAQEAQKAASGIKTIAEIVGFLGGEGAEESVEVLNDIATSMEGVGTAMQGYAKIQSGDVIGGAVDMIKGTWSAVSTWLDNGNKKIDREIKKSENAVKDLELAYKNLERAVEKAYGTAVIGAQKVAAANKEAQLAEVKRQLKLEESRDSKHRDENRIRELRSEIIDLENEIADKTEQIVNDLLGISSVGDAMESLMDGFVEALRSGEDAMKVFDESVDDMIANMVKKMFTTKILTPWFEQQWENIQKEVDERGSDEAKRVARIKEEASKWSLTGDGHVYLDRTSADPIYRELEQRLRDSERLNRTMYGHYATESDVRKTYDEMLRDAENALTQATTPTTEDIEKFAELLRSGQPIMEGSIDEIKELLVRLGLMKDSANKNLSALQQGIQGVTENTAGAIEAYMNSVSQQVYLHSDLLVQIRDAVVAMDSDAQLGVQAQMLLQLQQSYAIQVAIQGILAGWSNPSGLAVRVEMV